MNSIETAICESISIIVDKAIAEAGYDKTIQGTIAGTVDSTIGSYKVSYQNSTFTAYSTSTDVTYTTGATVYVLVPSGDFSNDKTILGTVKKLGINYVSTAEGAEAYDVNGISVVTSSDIFELSSYYPGTYAKLLYSKDNNEEDNLISIDETAIDEYIKTSESLICGMTVQTKIPTANQYSGNYGIIFALDFISNSTGETVTRYYTVDVDKMTGNPYKLINATEQYGIFDIDNENFVEINYISLFSYGFPNTKENEEDCEADIFISDIILCGAVALSSEDLSSYSLTFSTPQGTYFTSSNLDSDTITLVAQVRVKGKVIDNDSQTLPYYWFIEHSGINSQSLYYNKYGGQGWKCLNDYSIIDEENGVVEWVSGTYQFTIKKSDVSAASVTYKCAVIYDGTVLTKTIEIKNLSSEYEITVESDCGTQFYYDIGHPNLTCYVNGETSDNYTYSWSETTYDGVYSALSETSALNEGYEETLENYNNLVADIASGEKTQGAYAELLATYESTLKAYNSTIQRVQGNTIYNLDISAITSFSTYACTVYYGTLYLGTASITIVNSLTKEGEYNLRINNGSYVYKYDENGISPASSSQDNPIDIQSLTFSIYDNLGNDITDNITDYCIARQAELDDEGERKNYIKWTIPTVDTMIEIPSAYDYHEDTEKDDESISYYNLSSFSYTIASKYDITAINNDIGLEIKYQGILIGSTITSLTFIKEGQSGTNGSLYTCKIVLNVAAGDAPKYPIITEASDGTWSLNYTTKNANVWFKAQLWNSENLILESPTSATSDEGIAATITWSLLQNTYTAKISDPSSLSVLDEEAGTFTYNGYNTESPANIIKLTIKYNGSYYYATLPVITIKNIDDNYKISLKDNTGFQYVTYTSDGQNPKYDNAHPFEINVLKYDGDASWDDQNSGYSSDTGYINENLTYTWDYLGQVYEDEWVSAGVLSESSLVDDTQLNQKTVKPASEFDGQCVTNAVECIVNDAEGEVARIHMPVHLLLNKYGLSYLNSWDGNSVTIDEDGGYILAPQIGAGIKESDNSFTGIVVGAVKESGSSTTETGLFGYSSGVRSIFLDASDGSATFGSTGKGQIVIDPSDNKAQIYSGNYSTTAGTGMMIDLTTPYIQFGSGNFSVNANGYITAKGGGSIAGFNIDDDSLYTGSKSSSSNVRISSADFNRTVNGQSDSTMRMAFSNNFGVNSSGNMYAASGTIGSGSSKITLGKSSSTSASALYSGSKSSLTAAASGFYLGTDGLALGIYNSSTGCSPFQVDSSGYLQSKSGTIGGWTIGTASLSAGNITLYSNGSMSGGSSYTWSISSSGQAVFNYLVASQGGTIGGWTIGTNSLTGGNVSLNSDGSLVGPTWSITSDGVATFTNVYITNDSSVNTSMNWGNFSVDTSGNLNATNASISGSITASSISGGTISGTTISGGTISGTTIKGSEIDISADAGRINTGYGYGKSAEISYINSISVSSQGYVTINGVQYNVEGLSITRNTSSITFRKGIYIS